MVQIPEPALVREQQIADNSFYHPMHAASWGDLEEQINSTTKHDVLRALGHAGSTTIDEFAALISPAAEPLIEDMAQVAYNLTRKRFGRAMSLYVPLYLSNACSNSCVYCGYSHQNKLLRKTLTDQEILDEAKAIRALGFEHILLLTGEHPKECGFEYLKHAIELLQPIFPQISIEVQPMSSWEYEELAKVGLHAVYVYQETFNEERYPIYHPAGKKRDYRWRLETPDRVAAAGIHKVGIGALLGLENWRVESLAVAMHIRFLQQRYWKTRYSISFPRLRPHVGSFEPQFDVTDRNLVQIILAYRIFDENVEMSLTTREAAFFRDNMFPLGITALSAGSHTEPGGYAKENKELEQFEISDARSPEEIASMLHSKGYESVWKDWDQMLQ